jgi:hypothetical protein
VIIKGNIRTDGKALGNYLLSEGRYGGNREKNEQIEIWEAHGIEQGDTVQNILADFQHSAAGSQCKKPLFHVQFRTADGEALTREQWLEAVNRLEERLELTGHERVIVTHRLNGQDHVHVAWNRMDTETGKAAELHYYKHKCTDVARELEKEFGLRELSDDRKRGSLSHDEERQALRHGKSPQQIKEELRECWHEADNGQSFAAALDDRGYVLAKGDRRDFVIVGSEGEIYDVARVTGSRVAEVRHRLADLERENLPGVEEAKQIQLDRATTRDALKWEDELAKAAIEKTQKEESEARQLQSELKEKQRAGHLAATLYDRGGMVSMQHDAMRHLKDAHRHQQEQAKQEQQEKPEAQQTGQEVSDIRRDFWKELKSLKSGQQEQAREDKKARTEQTDYQQRKAERDAMREQGDARQGRPAQSNEEEGRERERERE